MLKRKQQQGDKARRARQDGVADSKDAATVATTVSATVARTIRVVAVADWVGMSGAMAFKLGDSAELVYASDGGWLCVRVGQHCGWVPAHYWRIVTEVRTAHTHTHTHTPVITALFSRTTRVSRYQKGKTNLDFTEARDSEWQ